MTRAEMKKLYGRIFLGILAFAALIGGIHFTGEIQRRLKGDEQNLGRAAEPKRLLCIRANVSTLKENADGVPSETVAMREIEPGYTYYLGTSRTFRKDADGWPIGSRYGYYEGQHPILSLECDGTIELEWYGMRVTKGEMRTDGFRAVSIPTNRVMDELALRIDCRLSYAPGYHPPGARVLVTPAIPREERDRHRYFNEMLTEHIAGLPHELRNAWRYAKESTLFITCYDKNDPERVIAEAELRFRQYENFRLDAIGRSEEYEAALRKYITPAYFGDTDLRKYFAYTEVEVVHYEQIEVME